MPITTMTAANGLGKQRAIMTAQNRQIMGHEKDKNPVTKVQHDFMNVNMATHHFSKTDSNKINRCRFYLQVYTIIDLLTHDGSRIHPEELSGTLVQSRQNIIKLVQHKWPLQCHWV
jgi:hypothetical protein